MSSSPLNTSANRRRTTARTAEHEAFSKITKEAEERLAKRQVARDEARKLRVTEIELQQRKAEQEDVKGETGGHSSLAHSHSAMKDITKNGQDVEKADLKQSSILRFAQSLFSTKKKTAIMTAAEVEPCSEEGLVSATEKVAEYEERIRRDMIIFSQLDNEKSALHYEVELIKDDMDEMRENCAQNQRENRDLTSEVKLLRRTIDGLEAEKKSLKHLLKIRDNLIHEHGLVMVQREVADDEMVAGSSSNGQPLTNGHEDDTKESCRMLNNVLTANPGEPCTEQLLFTQNTVVMVDRAVPGNQSLDDKVRKIVNTNKAIRTQLEEAEHSLHSRRTSRLETDRSTVNGPSQESDQHKDALKHAADLKFKLQECEREKNNIEGLNVRLDSQLKRCKTQSEEGEKEIVELKNANRSIKKELRDKECALDEQTETNKHLQNRLEKLRSSRQSGAK